MEGFSIFNEKDKDGRWWSFGQQQMDMSCGPTSVRITKNFITTRRSGKR
jgi:hypothetical protein